jgi:hypothetical protein
MTPSDMQLYLPLLIPLLVVAIFARRMLRPRRFRVSMVWVAPVLLAALSGSYLFHLPPDAGQASILAIALIAGGAIGWFRAQLTRIAIDPATGIITQRGTPYGLLLFAGLFVLRGMARVYALQHPELGFDLNRASGIFLVFAFGLLAGYAGGLTVAVGRARRGAVGSQPAEEPAV